MVICSEHEAEYHDFFISYREDPDKQLAIAIKKTIETYITDVTVFLDQDCLIPGRSWLEGFTQGLQKSRLIILVLTTNSFGTLLKKRQDHQTDHVFCEIKESLKLQEQHSDRILPLCINSLKESDPPEEVPFKPWEEYNFFLYPDVDEEMKKLYRLQTIPVSRDQVETKDLIELLMRSPATLSLLQSSTLLFDGSTCDFTPLQRDISTFLRKETYFLNQTDIYFSWGTRLYTDEQLGLLSESQLQVSHQQMLAWIKKLHDYLLKFNIRSTQMASIRQILLGELEHIFKRTHFQIIFFYMMISLFSNINKEADCIKR